MSVVHTTVGEVLVGIQTGKSVKTKERPAQPGELGILRVSSVTWGEFRPQENKAILDEYEPGDCPRPMDGDLLISRANTRDLVGAPVLVRGDHPNLLLSDKILRLIPNEARVERRYLALALRTAAARRHFESCAGGTSGSMTNVTQDDIRSAPLRLPPLGEQRRISDILDKADAIRHKRKEAIALTEELLRSAFLEMFGDPVTNPKGWPIVELGALVVDGPQNGLYRPSSDYGSGTPILRIDSFYDGHVTKLEELKRVRIEQGLIERYALREGDVIINRVNSRKYLGKSAIVPALREATVFESNMMRVTLDPLRAHPRYVVSELQQPSVRRQIDAAAKDAVNQSSINQSDVAALLLRLPPLEAQVEYARVVDKVRAAMHGRAKAASEAEALFNSLVASAFSGGLSS